PLTEPRAWFARIAGIASWTAALTLLISGLTAVFASVHPVKQILIVAAPTGLAALLRYFIQPISARVLSHLLTRSLTVGSQRA
ncbi:MAG: hypothetical protein ABJE95_08070, partial [Byssovorax sp.]